MCARSQFLREAFMARRTHNIIPFDVRVEGRRMKVTWDSIIWFGVVTTLASVAGSYIWTYLIQPNLSAPPAPGTGSTGQPKQLTSASAAPMLPAPSGQPVGRFGRFR
jgi:hypothetical protein